MPSGGLGAWPDVVRELRETCLLRAVAVRANVGSGSGKAQQASGRSRKVDVHVQDGWELDREVQELAKKVSDLISTVVLVRDEVMERGSNRCTCCSATLTSCW